MVQEEKGDRVVLRTGEIDRLSKTHYNSIKILVHFRWNTRDWEWRFRNRTRKTKEEMCLVGGSA
jgi:hypothetical protein